MEAVIISPIRETTGRKVTSAIEEIISAVEIFDLDKLKELLPNEPVLMQDLDKVFTSYTLQGHYHLKSFPASCSCMIDKHTAVSFHTVKQLENAVFYPKEFALVFTQDKVTGEHSYFKFCADMKWRKKYSIKS